MLIKLIEHLRKEDIYLYPQKGIVVDNDDPKKLGRLKCTIKNRWEDSDSSKLPWVYPLRSFFLGGSPNTQVMSVPEIDTELQIVFPFADEYSPFYTGTWVNENTKSSLFEEDYPETWGLVDSTPQWFRVNKKQLVSEYFNSLGDLIYFDGDGNLLINVPQSLVINTGKGFQVKCGDFTVSADALSLDANGITLKSGTNISAEAGASIDMKATASFGLFSSGVLALEGTPMEQNSGVVLGIVDADMGTHSSRVSELESKVSELQGKVEELKALCDKLKEERTSAESKIKEG